MPKTQRRVVAPLLDDFVEERWSAPFSSASGVVREAMGKYGCSQRTVEYALARVKAKWMKANAATLEERRARACARLERSIKIAQEQHEDSRAVAALERTLVRVEGVEAPKKLEHSGTVGLKPVAAMSPQERHSEIEQLIRKRQAALNAGSQPVIDVASSEAPSAPENEFDSIELPPDIRPSSGGRKTKTKARPKAKPRVH